MSCFSSSKKTDQEVEADKRSKEIESQLKEDRKNAVFKLLLLGSFPSFTFCSESFALLANHAIFAFPSSFLNPFAFSVHAISSDLFSSLPGTGDAGKSTFAKQMKVIHQDGFTKQEYGRFTDVLRDNCLVAMQVINTHDISISLTLSLETPCRCQRLETPR